MADTNVYLQCLDDEVYHDGTFTAGLAVRCHQHGDLQEYFYDAYIPWKDISKLVEKHLHQMHYTGGF